jgi:hypothetical protein
VGESVASPSLLLNSGSANWPEVLKRQSFNTCGDTEARLELNTDRLKCKQCITLANQSICAKRGTQSDLCANTTVGSCQRTRRVVSTNFVLRTKNQPDQRGVTGHTEIKTKLFNHTII